MEKETLQIELDSAYKSLDKAERRIKNLLIECQQQKMIIDLLEAGRFITDGKLDDARDFVRAFKSQ